MTLLKTYFFQTGSLEGQTFKKTGTLPNLSEQNLVDCSKSYGNEGCKGGWYENSFKYIRDNHGIDSETGYPYYARVSHVYLPSCLQKQSLKKRFSKKKTRQFHFFNKVAGCGRAVLPNIESSTGVIPVIFVKFFRTPFS